MVIDITDPTNPGTPVSEDTSGYSLGIHVSGDYAYIADASSGLAVIDISDPGIERQIRDMGLLISLGRLQMPLQMHIPST